ncbi:hypothetical protein J5X84_31790 [Streptosporangiaceae bacterium NEAU-GS5]|nr:hypothetical protein [Streptosporangiaceae bacterium NEAU-GS5]
MSIEIPEPYSHAWLGLAVPYIREVAEALGERVAAWWDDPFDPRDATVRLCGGWALVWDEESGWRHGRFLSGVKGVRTALDEVRYLGGGVLPAPERVIELLDGPYGSPVRPVYRSYTDLGDGFDATLAAYGMLTGHAGVAG